MTQDGSIVVQQFMTVKEAADYLEKEERWVRQLCIKGRIEGAVREKNGWKIPAPPCVLGRPAGLLNATEAASEKGYTRQRMAELCRLGRVVGAKMVGSTWMIPSPVEVVPGSPGRRRACEAADE